MTDEVIETVLQEILEEQKEAIKTNQQLIAKIEYLSNQIQSINRKQNNGEVKTASILKHYWKLYHKASII